MKFTVAPLTADRWPDLEAVFNAKGCSVARGCWCMAYRLSGSRGPLPRGMTRAQANRAALKALVDAGNPPGLLSYRGKIPVGWGSPEFGGFLAWSERHPAGGDFAAGADDARWVAGLDPRPQRGAICLRGRCTR